MVFDGPRIRDIGFAAMPQLSQTKLERTTLALAPGETLLYGANIINMQQQFDWLLEPAGAGSVAGPLQSISSALTSAGVTKEDWKAAFGDEISVMAAWPANAQLPNAAFSVAVHDGARARKIADAIASSSGWQKISRNNAEYYTAPTSGVLAVVSPTIAVSDRFLIAGLNAASVDGVISPTTAGGGLAGSEKFRSASKLVPDPSQIFVYLDLAGLYSRLDATVRPILQMGAAFVPGLSQRLDPSKLPPTEVVTKHLSPVVASTSYVNGGYRSESAGTITIEQAAIAGGAAYVGAMILQQHQAKGGRLPPCRYRLHRHRPHLERLGRRQLPKLTIHQGVVVEIMAKIGGFPCVTQQNCNAFSSICVRLQVLWLYLRKTHFPAGFLIS